MSHLRDKGLLVLGALLVTAGVMIPAAAQSKAGSRELTDGKSFGSKTAPITIQEFSDFQCPACRQLYLQTVRPLMDEYVASGKVHLIYRDFPLPVHKYSREASRYADAAARIGKFAKVEAALFDKQPEWSESGNVEAVVASVLTPAEMKRVEQILRGGQVDQSIDKDVALGNQYQVRQTPTMVVTHNRQTTPIAGVVSYEILRMWLNQLLRQ